MPQENCKWFLSCSKNMVTAALAGVSSPSESELKELWSVLLCTGCGELFSIVSFCDKSCVSSGGQTSSTSSMESSKSAFRHTSSTACRSDWPSLNLRAWLGPLRDRTANLVSRWLPSREMLDRKVRAANRLREWFFFRAAAIPRRTVSGYRCQITTTRARWQRRRRWWQRRRRPRLFRATTTKITMHCHCWYT